MTSMLSMVTIDRIRSLDTVWKTRRSVLSGLKTWGKAKSSTPDNTWLRVVLNGFKKLMIVCSDVCIEEIIVLELRECTF